MNKVYKNLIFIVFIPYPVNPVHPSKSVFISLGTYSGFELSVQSELIELPLASASGVRFEMTGLSRIGKRILFRTAFAKALWKSAFPEFWLKPLPPESLVPPAKASGNSAF